MNIASVWLLNGGGRHHHGLGHGHSHDHAHENEEQRVTIAGGLLVISIFEDGVPPRFRVRSEGTDLPSSLALETVRPDGKAQAFRMLDQGDHLESADEIPEPHAFVLRIRYWSEGGEQMREVAFTERHHGDKGTHRDNNMRAAVIHVLADAAVSVLVIAGLILARIFGWLWMDPLAGMVGACVIASWSYGLIRDTGAILLDMVPDRTTEACIRQTVEQGGDRVTDLHLWRLGPGHVGAILSIATRQATRGPEFYRQQLARFKNLSHVTVEVVHA